MDISKVNSIKELKVIIADAFIARENAQAQLQQSIQILNASFERLELLEQRKDLKSSSSDKQ